MRRRTALTALVAVGVLALLGSYIAYTQRVVRDLRGEAQRWSRMSSAVYAARADTSESASLNALGDIALLILHDNVPLIVTDRGGRPVQFANLPASVDTTDDAVRAYAAVLDAENPPVTDSIVFNTVHYGSTRLVQGLRIIPALQVTLLFVLLLVGAVLLRTFDRAERDRVWAGMARESAHQIGTPLSSMHGWMAMLRDRAGDPLVDSALDHMSADVERLERVAHRFERIGRPPKREPVDVSALVERVVTYFRARVPTLTTPVHFTVDVHGEGLTVSGDRVLLEWVMESLIKNAVDALAGVGGTVTVHAESLAGNRVRIRVEDDGPGIPRALRNRIFDAGFSTKERGWGIGLALTRRIVEENHGGRLTLAPAAKGAAFDVILPA
jgi:signal transduction histidine kinase